MGLLQETVDLYWEGPLTEAPDLPMLAITGLVLTLRNTATYIPWESVRRRLKRLLGAPQESRRWRSVRMRWPGGKLPITAKLTRRRIRLTAARTVPPRRLEGLVKALAGVPHLTDLRIQGTVPRNVPGPSRRPAWMNGHRRFR